jgi:opacity protein-like surface antigen
LAASQIEEDQFYARTEFGPRFMSAMNLVSVSGPNGNYGILNQKKIAFSTGYRQDISAGVWLTEWFGLAVETGFALNAVRGNTQGMTVSSTTFWTVPLLAQLCFQYPNDSGWIPYINLGFGGGWTIFKVGGIDYTSGGSSLPASLSGTGNSVNNAYQIAAGVRYRLYEELSLTMAYKFYGNSQANMNLDNGVQITLGSPVTQSAEVGLNFSF